MNFTRSQLFGATAFVVLGFGVVASECRTRQIVRKELDEAYKEEWDAAVHGNGGLGHVGSWAPIPGNNGPLFGQNGVFTSGEGRISPIVRNIEPTHDVVLVDAGSTIVYTIPVGIGDCVAAATTGLLYLPDAAAGINGVAWGNNQWFGCSNQSGVFTWPDGGTANSVNLFSAGSLLQDAGLALVYDAGPVVGLGSLNYQCTVGQQAWCENTLSADYVGQPWVASGTPAVLAINPSTSPTTVSSNTIISIQATYGAFALGTRIASVTLPGGVACINPTRWTDGVIYCTILSGSYSANSGPVTVTLANPSNNPFGYTTITAGGSFAFANTSTPGAVSAIYPNRGVSGTTVHGTISSCVNCTTGNTQAAFVCSGVAVAATVTSIVNSASPSAFTVTSGANAESTTANNCNLVLNSGGTLGGSGFTGGNSSTGGTGVYFQEPAGLVANWDAKFGSGTSYTLVSSAVSSVVDFQGGYTATDQGVANNRPAGITANYNTSGFPALAPTGTTGGTTQFLFASTFPTTSAPLTACVVGDSQVSASFYFFDGNVSGGARCFIGGVSSNQLSCNDGTGTALIQSTTYTAGTPVELCMVDNGTSSASTLYVNGTSVNTSTFASIAGIQNGVALGALAPFVGGSYLNGHWGEIQIWNTALSGTQISHHHLEDVADWKTP